MDNYLLLQSGADIPFPQAQLTIHQPTIKEISLLGEEGFRIGCEILNFSKNSLLNEDKKHLENQTNFDIILNILKDNNSNSSPDSYNAIMILLLLFPKYQIEFNNDSIVFTDGAEKFYINNSNYNFFKDILISMFKLEDSDQEYNPGNKRAQEIAEKLKKAKQRKQNMNKKNKEKKPAILDRYISILAVGEKKDKNALLNYTVYQLYDEFDRYQLWLSSDMYIRAKMAGASGMQEPDDWFKDFHYDDKPKQELKRINTI